VARQQCSQQRLTVDRVGLCPPPTPWHSDRRGIDHVAFDTICVEQSVNPEAVEPGFLDDDDRDRSFGNLFGSHLQASQQAEQGCTITSRGRVLRHLLAAGR
jgi:hypothetical protein